MINQWITITIVDCNPMILAFTYIIIFLFAAEPQIIEPKVLGLTLKPGFGYSLSKDKIDVDGNKCNDFAVGYPNSNQAVLLRSKEVVILVETQNPVSFQPLEPINPQIPIDTSKLFYRKISFS